MDKQEPEIKTSILIDGHLVKQFCSSGPAEAQAREQVLGSAYSRLEEQLYNRVGEAAAIYSFVSWIIASHRTIGEEISLSEVAALISQYCDTQGWQIGNQGNWLEGIRPMGVLPPSVKLQVANHLWRIEVLCDCHLYRTEFYKGSDYREMVVRLGEACLSHVVDKVFVWRDEEQILYIETRGGAKETNG